MDDLLPCSPLTHSELNSRVQDLLDLLAWRTVSVLRDGGIPDARDLESMRGYATQIEALQAAAMQRVVT